MNNPPPPQHLLPIEPGLRKAWRKIRLVRPAEKGLTWIQDARQFTMFMQLCLVKTKVKKLLSGQFQSNLVICHWSLHPQFCGRSKQICIQDIIHCLCMISSDKIR